jgi:glycosyltransferase involved in cell wall biosynthesis
VIQPYKNRNFISINARKASIARNKGAELAKGSILVFLDADTIIPQNLLSTIHAQFTPQYSVATVKAVPDQQKLIPNLMLWSKELYITLKLRISSNGIIITNKDTFQKIKFREDLPFHEDGIFMRQAAKLGKFLYIKSTTVTESMRRYQIMGYIKPTWFWIKEFWKNIFGKRAKEYPLAR